MNNARSAMARQGRLRGGAAGASEFEPSPVCSLSDFMVTQYAVIGDPPYRAGAETEEGCNEENER